MSKIRISLKGNNVRRFINLCSSYDIELYALKYVSFDEYECIINTNDYYLVKQHLKKTKTKAKIIRRLGLLKWYKPFTRFWYCLIPFFLIVTYLYVKTLRVADINISGVSSLSEERIESFLNKQNIGIGSWIYEYDCSKAELMLNNQFDEIIWSSIGIQGNVLSVDIREATKSYDKEEQACRSIIASSDAVIYSIITRRGTPLVKAGDVVLRGDVLVDSKQEILDDNLEVKDTYFTCSDADILGYVYRDNILTIPSQIGIISLDYDTIAILSDKVLDKYIKDLEENGVLILSKNVIMNKVGNCIYMNVNLHTIESIVKYSY